MAELYARCGLDCSKCDAYIATKNNDTKLKAEIAKKWKAEFGFDAKPEDINCVGCSLEGAHIGYCNECKVRSCANSKGVENCAKCDSYMCETLKEFVNFAKEAGKNLEELKDKQ
ncbi:MAG TPA: DUF3795 domain-containing protein [Caldisericia bacterium]|nr:DUF3795 domain-containing protein [Caldisericia bacterium]HOU07836.1 DUF3795 domain-containing protein [Caldisericia bacterium]HPL89456.1 DUF3795 domain-containing protein [Caldisericia bacterium]HQG59405.1 DUF3795 domain-containing protein [Caldisericia bacterium]HQH48363.1 DUF3795 domain-containing protein [Caldisericia bacterium]